MLLGSTKEPAELNDIQRDGKVIRSKTAASVRQVGLWNAQTRAKTIAKSDKYWNCTRNTAPNPPTGPQSAKPPRQTWQIPGQGQNIGLPTCHRQHQIREPWLARGAYPVTPYQYYAHRAQLTATAVTKKVSVTFGIWRYYFVFISETSIPL